MRPGKNPYLASFRSRSLQLDDYLNIPPEGVQEPKKPLGREAFQASPPQRGYFWLVYAKYGSGFALGESSPDEVKVFHRTLRPEGVLYDVSVSSDKETDALLGWLRSNTWIPLQKTGNNTGIDKRSLL